MKRSVLLIGMSIVLSFILISYSNGINKNLSSKIPSKICFEFKNETYSNTIEIEFLANNKVKGSKTVWIHTDEYENTSDSEFTGEISGEKITVDLTIEIEGNIEEATEIWEYKDDVLIENGREYVKVECQK